MSSEALAHDFEIERPRLRAAALRILSSESDADDVVQEAWIRLSRVDAAGIDNLAAWLTTVVSRLSLNVLRSRRRHATEPVTAAVGDALADDRPTPEDQAVVNDAVRAALFVVLDTLEPAERVAVVLHDVFGVPFAVVAEILERSVAATRQLAARARRRLQPGPPASDASTRHGHEIVDAFFAAGRAGDLNGLLTVLHPDVELRVDTSVYAGPLRVRGAREVAARARLFADAQVAVTPVDIAGLPAVLLDRPSGETVVMVFTVEHGLIAAIDSSVTPTGATG